MPRLRPLATAVAVLLPTVAAAQAPCSRTMATPVPESVQYGPSATCSGLSFSSHGVTLATSNGCPLFVTITPRHHDVAPSRHATDAVRIGTVDSRVLFFVCRTNYLIFIPLGSTCVFDREVVWAQYPLLATVPCAGA